MSTLLLTHPPTATAEISAAGSGRIAIVVGSSGRGTVGPARVEEDAVIELTERDPGTGAQAGATPSLTECEELLDDTERDVLNAADDLLEALEGEPDLLADFPPCQELDDLLDTIRRWRTASDRYQEVESGD